VKGFTLKALEIDGATAFTQRQLSGAYADYIGKTTDIEVLRFIAARVTQIYRDKGFLLSRAIVPVQEIKDGRARIAVVEGYVSQVRIEGEGLAELRAKDRLGLVGKARSGITSMRPLHAPTLEKLLLTLNDFPGVKAEAVLEPLPPSQSPPPGAIGMLLKIDRTGKAWSGSVGADNFGSRYTGPLQLSANAGVTGAFTSFDSLSAGVLVTPDWGEVKLFSGSYSVPLNARGTSVSLQGGYSSSNPGYTLAPADINSDTWTGTFKLSQSLLRSRQTSLSAAALLDFKNVAADTVGTVLYRDRVRALRLAAAFSHADKYRGITAGNFTLSQGLDFLGARETGTPNLSRARGHSDFTKVEAGLSRTQNLGESWQAYGAAQGQHAFETLLSSEEFGYGGQTFGRAYDPSELVGDDGVAAGIEMRYLGVKPFWQITLQPYGFYDIGKVWQRSNGNTQSLSGASTGGGLKFVGNQSIGGSFSVALPLTRTPEAPTSSNGRGPRWLAQVSSYF
jgi:hemolysin activation/secretion protein